MKACEQCGHQVANLSLLAADEREALLRRAETERVCGTYWVRLSGELVTPEAPLSEKERRSVKQYGVAALSAGALLVAAGCAAPAKPSEVAPSPPPVRSTPLPSVTARHDVEVVRLMGIVAAEPQKVPKKTSPRGK
jgi:hypothetical protein